MTPYIVQEEKMHDLVNICLFSVDFKMETQKEKNIFVIFRGTISEKGKETLFELVKNYRVVQEPSD